MQAEDLLNTMEDLTEEDFTVFKWHLKQPGILEGYKAIKPYKLEMAARWKTVDLMVNTYTLHGALAVTKKILEKINRNDLVLSLSNTSSGPEETVSRHRISVSILCSCRSVHAEWETSSLRQLDLQDSGVNLLSAGLQCPYCTLESHRVEPGGVQSLRQHLRKYSCELTFDINTISIEIELSDNNRKVTNWCRGQPYPDHPDRFDVRPPQLLCTNALTGRYYWEVEWTGRVDIAVSYRGIRRKGETDDRKFGRNDQSWSLSSGDSYSVWHNNRETSIPFSSYSSSASSSCPHFTSCYSDEPDRVGVYVDCPAGILSFYRVSSDTLIHLHTFNTTFTEPLYPGFGLGFGEWFALDTLSLCSL